MAVAFLAFIALNGGLLAIASSIDPRQENQSRIESIANALLRPADALKGWFAPGHGGAQIAVLFHVLRCCLYGCGLVGPELACMVANQGIVWQAVDLRPIDSGDENRG